MPHSFTSLKYHIVFGTKYRLPLITERFERELYAYIGGIIYNKSGQLIEIGGIEDHIHILTGFHQSRSVASMVGAIKSNSSSFGKESSDDHTFGWQMGYAAFTVSESQVARVKRYIRRQKIHHQTLSFEDEMRTLFQRHGVEFDEAFLRAEPEDS
jgi:REP element-mobilizing transposase RayT